MRTGAAEPLCDPVHQEEPPVRARETLDVAIGTKIHTRHDSPSHSFDRKHSRVPAFQRFDLEGTANVHVITDHDMKRRWATFHGDMRRMSGKWWQRAIGRLLGDDTRRYQVARYFGRPILKAVRRLRDKPDLAVAARATHVASKTFFPVNYQPHHSNLLVNQTRTEVALGDITTVEVDEITGSWSSTIETLRQVVDDSPAKWLFIVDTSCAAADRAATMRALAHFATDHDDVVFADEHGSDRSAPIFKSAFVAPHTLLSYNLVGRPALVRLSALREAGGFSREAGWAFEHDAYLRLSEAGATFRHVTLLLPAGRPPIAFTRAHIDDDTCRVVTSALSRRGWRGTVGAGAVAGVAHWTLDAPSPAPSIDIIIPTRDRIDLVRRCIDAIESLTTYENYNIILLDNDSVEQESLDYFAATKYRVVPCPGPFNYAKIVNRGIDHSTADFVLTLNNDTILQTADWLERLVSLALLPDVVIVGACLLDQHGHREHESIVIAPYPQHLRTDSNYPKVDQFSIAVRDVAAVTGAVQMVRREFWVSLGGMDETLAVTMNDVDLCLRAQSDGRYVLYTPDVQLVHYVSSSRGTLDPLEDRNRFIRRWDIFGTFRDPFFPEALLLLGETMYYLPR